MIVLPTFSFFGFIVILKHEYCKDSWERALTFSSIGQDLLWYLVCLVMIKHFTDVS